jgi:hypothetical protein
MADWYPGPRDNQIHLVETWLQVFQTKAAGWNIPPASVTDLAAAKEILAVVKSGERTEEHSSARHLFSERYPGWSIRIVSRS